MEYDDEGIPMCTTCKKNAEECECWDNEDIHEIIAFRIENELVESENLQLRLEYEEDEEPE